MINIKRIASILTISGIFSIAFATGFLISKNHYTRDTSFLLYGQYDPEYIEYDDEQMLLECEKHGFIYLYEDGICVLEQD
jgi:hypothetical protein